MKGYSRLKREQLLTLLHKRGSKKSSTKRGTKKSSSKRGTKKSSSKKGPKKSSAKGKTKKSFNSPAGRRSREKDPRPWVTIATYKELLKAKGIPIKSNWKKADFIRVCEAFDCLSGLRNSPRRSPRNSPRRSPATIVEITDEEAERLENPKRRPFAGSTNGRYI